MKNVLPQIQIQRRQLNSRPSVTKKNIVVDVNVGSDASHVHHPIIFHLPVNIIARNGLTGGRSLTTYLHVCLHALLT